DNTIPPNAPGANDGTDWANACHDTPTGVTALDVALSLAFNEQAIYVRSTPNSSPLLPYRPTTQSTGFVITKRLKIYGGWFGDETGGPPTRHGDPLRTVLDGDIAGDDSQGLYGDNAYHVLQITGVTGRSHKPGVILDRFVIRGGHSTLPNSQNLYG